jgi:hypothetical protein
MSLHPQTHYTERVKPLETTLSEKLVYGLAPLAEPLKLRTPRAGGYPRPLEPADRPTSTA